MFKDIESKIVDLGVVWAVKIFLRNEEGTFEQVAERNKQKREYARLYGYRPKA